MSLSVNNLNPSAIPPTLPPSSSPLGLLALPKRFVEVENVGDSSCYNDIVAKYPGMDSASQTMVKMLCENVLKTLDAGNIALSDQGIHGIRDAFKKNTNLESFSIFPACLDSDEDCHTTFALDMVSALQVNRGLKTLNLRMDAPQNPMLAIQELFMNLPCFNLATFGFKGQITPTVAEAVFPKFSQKFPLANFTWTTYLTQDDPVGSIISSLSNGIGNNTCFKTLNLVQNNFNATTITTLFEGIGASRIQRFDLPWFIDENGRYAPYAFSTEQTAVILEAVRSNPCFLECVPANSPLPADLAAAIDNITKTRTPCQPDPTCDVSVACSTPTPPAPLSSLSFLEGAIIGGVTGTVLTALTALGIYTAQKCARSGESQPLLEQNIQQV